MTEQPPAQSKPGPAQSTEDYVREVAQSTENEARRLAEDTIRTALDCAHPVTGDEHEACDEAYARLEELLTALFDAEANRDAWKTNAGGWQSRALAAEANLVSMQRENEEIHRSYEAKLREYADRELLLLDVAQAARFEEECAPELRHDAKVRKLRALAALTRSNGEEAT